MKKLVCMALAGIRAVSALVGCGKDSGSSSQNESGKAPDASAQEQSGSGKYTEVGTYNPIVTEPVELRVFVPQPSHIIDFSTNETTKFLEEYTGLKLNFETSPTETTTEKVNMILTSGQDLPDCFLGIGTDVARFGVEEGLLIDLTELIDTKMVQLQKMFEKHDTLRGAMTATDGKIYEAPSYQETYHVTMSLKMWANTEQLKKMGVEVPTTTEEFYNVCKMFKEQNPNGLPFIGGQNWNGDPLLFMTNAFTFRTDNTYGLRLNKEKKVETCFTTDEYREALRFMNRLYSEGLLYEGSFTMTVDQMKSLLVEEGEPVLFFTGGASVNVIDTATSPELYSHYYPIAPLEGPDGFRCAAYMPSTPVGCFSITKDCKEPEAAARFADYILTTEGTETIWMGPKGVGWDDPDEGAVGLNGKPALYKRLLPYSHEPQNINWQDLGFSYQPTEYRFGEQTDPDIDIFSADGLEKLLLKATEEEYEPYITDEYQALPSLSFLLDENQQLQTIKVELKKFASEGSIRFVTGDRDINSDSAWEEFVNGLDNIGLGTLLEVYQTAYDRQYTK